MKVTYLKWMRSKVWHIERSDRHTVCGLPTPIDGAAAVARRNDDARPRGMVGRKVGLDRVCASCERMAGSETMRTMLR
jgi:hypothetical protein